jgi:hypothetical protein
VLTNPQVSFRSTDPAVATVGADGLIAALGNGTATVLVDAGAGVVDSARVTVSQRVAWITVATDTLRFDALTAVLPLEAVARDRLGSPVTGASPTYVAGDDGVASVDISGNVRANGNGVTVVAATLGGDTASVVVRVAQRAVRLEVPTDTVVFDAVGEDWTIAAVALDSLGSPLSGGALGGLGGTVPWSPSGSTGESGVANLSVADSAVAGLQDSVTVQSRANGVTTATFSVAGVTGHVVVVVDQVPTTLTAAVTFGNPVVTLPVGAPLPLACQALDKNGFPIPEDPALVGSVQGTVTGDRCSDARVQHSGYDTLFFALGALQARVPVIVATAPDSVGVVAAAKPLTTVQRDLFVGEDLAHPSILALRPLVADIFAAYGNPTTNLDRARAIRDWLARTAIHPHARVHPSGSTANLGVLPPGKTWADVNGLPSTKVYADRDYWWAVGYDGYVMLDKLLGTLDPATGRRADDGMMTHVEGARYRIRDIASYRFTLCTFQEIMLNALWAAAGLHGMLITTIDHDPAAVFIPELGRWVYEDPTYNEEYLLDGVGEPLSPTDLLALSSAGEASRLRATSLPGPGFDPEPYVEADTYINEGHPGGMVIMGSQLNSRVVGVGGWPTRLVQIDVPQLTTAPSPFNDPVKYDRVTADVAFPALGPTVSELGVEDSVYVVRLSSTFPNHQRFERRLSGQEWERVGEVDVLPVGACRVEYRSVDAAGNVSASTVFDVWVPRAEEFVGSALPGNVRTQARYCVSIPGI